jgi:hypothetical protein
MKEWFNNAIVVLKRVKQQKGLLGIGVMILLLLTSFVWFPIGCALGVFGVIMVVVGTLINKIGEYNPRYSVYFCTSDGAANPETFSEDLSQFIKKIW